MNCIGQDIVSAEIRNLKDGIRQLGCNVVKAESLIKRDKERIKRKQSKLTDLMAFSFVAEQSSSSVAERIQNCLVKHD